MRTGRNRRRGMSPGALALLALTLGLVACDSTNPSDRAMLVAQGDLEYSCGANCQYEGEAVNSGLGCAIRVRGVTRLLDNDGREIARDDWDLDSSRRIQKGERFLFRGCCFSPLQVSAADGSKTQISWDDTGC